MSRDEAGNDLGSVPVPIGGLLAFAPYAAANVIADADLGGSTVELSEAYKLAGLIKQDGAPQHARESGDALEFWQAGYIMPGDGTRTVQANLAENTEAVLELVEGKEPDSNGVIYVDSSLPAARLLLFLATKYKNGTEDRYNGVAQITAIEVDRDTRGEVRGRSVTFTWQEDPLFNGAPFKMWHGNPKSAPEPDPEP
ncbi:hypothetical protein U6G28_02630 [Actinomycetaceae bacterium MB13-C1-2]|nr:hypothetical protein U6G28_02630 [Actinomycetaceae bacterium MB13-C1-2]